ncbi:MAG: helix-turn-helix transcriptional regulator [Planctomycetaceae bacterium]
MSPLDFQHAFGQVIRSARSRAGHSQEAFAAIVGLHRTYIGAIERGEQNVSLRNLCRIADALAVPLSELITEAENLRPKNRKENRW